MVSRVLYRPFHDADFDALVSVVRKQWHAQSPNEQTGSLEAISDLSHYLSISTFSQVVAVDNDVRGIVLARAAQAPALNREHWQQVAERAIGQLRDLNAPVAQRWEDYMAREQQVNGELLRQSGCADAGQITLLAVDADTRGLGIGSVLLDAAESYLAAQGSRALYLYTDTDCTWKFYEHRGLKRAAAHRTTRAERKLLPREMYLYSRKLSA